MRLSLMWSLPLMLITLAIPPLIAQEAIPRCTSVEPANGPVGTEVAVTGENLSKDMVAKLYLTDGKNDIELTMSEQTTALIKTKIPAKAVVGVRYKLMVLTKGKEPKLIEQPVRFEVE